MTRAHIAAVLAGALAQGGCYHIKREQVTEAVERIRTNLKG